MPDPTPAAYRLFSWMRRGLLAGITDATGTGITSAPVAVVRGVFIIGVRPLISLNAVCTCIKWITR